MTKTSAKLSFKEYLTYDDSTDNRYELVDGELLMVPLPTANHADEVDFLLEVFRAEIRRQSLPWKVTDKVGVYIGKSPKTGKDYSRTPDICVLMQAAWSELKIQGSAAVLRTPPFLVVEVVSTNWEVDYIDKLDEYQRLGISEYWIVDYLAIGSRDLIGDPKQPTVSIYQLVESQYQVNQFRGNKRIISATFPELKLTVNQIL